MAAGGSASGSGSSWSSCKAPKRLATYPSAISAIAALCKVAQSPTPGTSPHLMNSARKRAQYLRSTEFAPAFEQPTEDTQARWIDKNFRFKPLKFLVFPPVHSSPCLPPAASLSLAPDVPSAAFNDGRTSTFCVSHSQAPHKNNGDWSQNVQGHRCV